MKIGELARKADCQVVTVRYYEKEGLMRRPGRSEGNYRVYSVEDADRLRFIRHCRSHGMSLAEIRDLLAYRDAPTGDCAWISEMVERHITYVDEQICSLNRLRAYLEDLRGLCPGGDAPQGCGIMNSLGSPERCACCAKAHPEGEDAVPRKTASSRKRRA